MNYKKKDLMRSGKSGSVATVFLIVILLLLVLIASSWYFISKRDTAPAGTAEEIFMDYFDSDDLDMAIEKIESELANDPDNVSLLILAASGYVQVGSTRFEEMANAEKAIELAKRAIKIDPTSSEAHRVVGYAYEIMEDYEKAHENYDKAINFDGRNALALANKGHAYELQGEYSLAFDFYQKAATIDSNEPYIQVHYARALVKTGMEERLDIALDYAKRASESKNVQIAAVAKQVMASVYAEKGDFENMEKSLKEANMLVPNSPQILVSLGKINLGKIGLLTTKEEASALAIEAIRYANEALEIHPKNTLAILLKADAALFMSESEEEKETKRQQYLDMAIEVVDEDISLTVLEKETLKEELILKKSFEVVGVELINESEEQ